MSPNQSVLIARTRTESVIDRSSPYNIIETSTDEEDNDNESKTSVQSDENNDQNMITERKETISPSSSITSTADVYMDAVDILEDEQSGNIFSIKLYT